MKMFGEDQWQVWTDQYRHVDELGCYFGMGNIHQSDPLGTTKKCLVCNSVNLIKKNKQISYRSRDIAAISLSVYNETLFFWKLTCLLRKVRKMIQFDDIIIFPNGLANKPHHLAYNSKRNHFPFFWNQRFPDTGTKKKTSKANDGSLFPMGAMKIIALRKMDLLWHSAIWKGFPTPRSWGLTWSITSFKEVVSNHVLYWKSPNHTRLQFGIAFWVVVSRFILGDFFRFKSHEFSGEQPGDMVVLTLTYRIHGVYLPIQNHGWFLMVDKYTSPMDLMGRWWFQCLFWEWSSRNLGDNENGLKTLSQFGCLLLKDMKICVEIWQYPLHFDVTHQRSKTPPMCKPDLR